MCAYICVSYSVASVSLQPHGLYVAHQSPLSMDVSRQEYWNGLLLSFPADLPDPRIELGSPALRAASLLSEPPGKPWCTNVYIM